MNTAIDHSLHEVVLPVLEQGEGLLWAGRPDPWRTTLYKVGQTVLVAVFFLLLLLVYVSGLPAAGAPGGAGAAAFILRPAVLTAAAIFMLYGLFVAVLCYLLARCTVYAVTNMRVLSVSSGRRTKAIRYEDMHIPLLDLRRDARGDIHFQGLVRTDGTEQRPQLSRFLGIESAESVYRLLLGQMLGPAHGRTALQGVENYLELLLGKGSAVRSISRE